MDIGIVFTALFVAFNCGILGVFLMLRKMAMVGDAISHSVLPGIVIAYLIAGTRASFPMLIGAAAMGLITTVLIEFLTKKARLQNDASIGISFTWLFAIGVILIAVFTKGGIDLDQECVLYGDIAYVNLDKIIVDGNLYLGPRAMWNQIPVFVLISVVILFGFRGWQITTFNPDYAASMGISVSRWHYLLMSMVSLVTVMAFEAVGAILVVGFMIIPPATAYLINSKLKMVIVLTLVFATLSVLLGYRLAIYFNGSIAGGMISVAGIIFFVIWCLQQMVKKLLVARSDENVGGWLVQENKIIR
ncbi:metal ABC transporter permease [Membranihabitans maritimus]|uniref:metal ABC transporter permease n=1 Tax=Membranihabitans maritimus TaxID=2904244 RepID=UPI001F1BB834|nr:metal ABC transporter permease [Membranihabitans maritimus]